MLVVERVLEVGRPLVAECDASDAAPERARMWPFLGATVQGGDCTVSSSLWTVSATVSTWRLVLRIQVAPNKLHPRLLYLCIFVLLYIWLTTGNLFLPLPSSLFLLRNDNPHFIRIFEDTLLLVKPF